MRPLVNSSIWTLRPDFVALSLVLRHGRNAESTGVVGHGLRRPAWAEDHLASWRQAYQAFGSKPQRTPCSAEALWRRVDRDSSIGGINAVVDLYNTISLKYAVPVGGEDVSAYHGVPRLERAQGDEVFQSTREGQIVDEVVEAGEVIWRDDLGVTCRRWNWRQTPRTRITAASTDMWFVIERLAPMPLEALNAAGEELAAGLLALQPGAEIETTLLRS